MSDDGRPFPELDGFFFRRRLALRYHLAHPFAELRLALRATNRAPALSLTLFFGLISLLYLFFDPAPGSWTWPRVVILVLGLGTAYVVGGLLALRLLPPDQYAQTVIAGNTPKVMLRTIAYRARKLAIAFIVKTHPTQDLFSKLVPKADKNCDAGKVGDAVALADELRELESACRTPLLKRSRLAQARRRIHRLLLRKDREFRRLEAMKLAAAEELEVPARRLCDQLIQFSPSMFEEVVRKYVNNLKEMLSMLEGMASPPEVARFCGLVRQNCWFEDAARRRALRLTELIRFRRLHGYLHAFVASPSTSGSLQVYSRALAEDDRPWRLKKAHRRAHLKARRIARWLRVTEERWRRSTWERLCFLYRKQRAHPGFDLHRLLVRLCEEEERRLDAKSPTERIRRDRHDLEGIRGLLEKVLEAVEPSTRHPPPPPPELPSTRELVTLALLPAFVSRALADARTEIGGLFRDVLAAWSRELHGDLYLVTRGYSKTVREVVRDLRAQPPPGLPLPHLFLLSGDSPNDEFDTRRMKLEVGQNDPNKTFHLAAGHGDLLLGLLSLHDRVVLVQGVECYDADRRLVHSRTAAEHLEGLLARLAAAGVPTLFVAVAESYKRQPQPLGETRFFTDHFDRVSIYRNADLVVSDRGIEPPAWRRRTAARLRPRRGTAAHRALP